MRTNLHSHVLSRYRHIIGCVSISWKRSTIAGDLARDRTDPVSLHLQLPLQLCDPLLRGNKPLFQHFRTAHDARRAIRSAVVFAVSACLVVPVRENHTAPIGTPTASLRSCRTFSRLHDPSCSVIFAEVVQCSLCFVAIPATVQVCGVAQPLVPLGLRDVPEVGRFSGLWPAQ